MRLSVTAAVHLVRRARTMSTQQQPALRRRFAPVPRTQTDAGGPPRPGSPPPLAGIVFDVDGTLCEPQTWMFARMRAALGIAAGVDILAHVYELAAGEQPAAMAKVRAVEREAMLQMVPQRGLVPLMEFLQARGIRKAICTRNYEDPVNYLIDNFMAGQVFSPVVTREFNPPKPAPDGILHIAEQWGLDDGGKRLIMVGDSMDDMAAGRGAGAATVLLVNTVNRHLAEHDYTDVVVERLDELIPLLERGFMERDRTLQNGDSASTGGK